MTATAPGTHLRIFYNLEKAGPCNKVGPSLPIDYPQLKILLKPYKITLCFRIQNKDKRFNAIMYLQSSDKSRNMLQSF